ncbi:MAG: YidC/Oxa1 family membrane protein insertase, partial [Alphaproteobacteria bacterium]|nr:YidC/Oxa1 family membrane protein insertase [Alphaproteobacteria bacterium]
SINMCPAPFFGWIHDLSMPDPSSVFTLFGYLDWPIPSFLNIGIWPVLMGITMWVQQKMTAMPAADKTQANMFKMMPIIFTFMMGSFASGLVIYWTWSNILSIAQQKYIMKKVGV